MELTRRRFCAILIAIAAAASLSTPSHAQASVAASDGALSIGGDVPRPFSIAPADLKQWPRTSVTVSEEGREVKYEGVLVAELLKKAGAPIGTEMNGRALASYVLATAKDGYQVVYSLGELDPAMAPNDIIVADTIDGKPLFEYQGPLRVVAPHDKRGARSVRMVQKLEVVRLRK